MKTITLTKLRIKKISELNLIRFANGGKQPFVFITAVNELDESIKVRVYGESKIKECAYYLNNQRRIDLEITLQSPKASKVESISEWTKNSWKKTSISVLTVLATVITPYFKFHGYQGTHHHQQTRHSRASGCSIRQTGQ